MKKQRAPRLTDKTLQTLIELIDQWSGKLTWELLLERLYEKTGLSYSRFTFVEYPQVADAFALKKQVLRGSWSSPPSSPKDERVRAALEQVARYKAKALRLEQENQALLEQFVTWALNAQRKGVDMTTLNAPLPKPNRDQSKVLRTKPISN